MKPLTVERLRQVLVYDPETGIFRWRMKRPGVLPDKIAGTRRKDGCEVLCVDGGKYHAKRLAVFYQTGKWPCGYVARVGQTGFKGVSRQRDKFKASAKFNGVDYHLGVYATAEQASEVYSWASGLLNHGAIGPRDFTGRARWGKNRAYPQRTLSKAVARP